MVIKYHNHVIYHRAKNQRSDLFVSDRIILGQGKEKSKVATYLYRSHRQGSRNSRQVNQTFAVNQYSERAKSIEQGIALFRYRGFPTSPERAQS